ncbi:hypothetical protein [Zavarzinia compransoris]|uniref:Uncharacterized protein n=1 Tax=Zavarzinia compransoris TaxID=1264899 RepID=A0A317DYH8_9PROT|nr:hypothetical protein [Zavarzinia compransoris]PWR18990.1 hypothetical protein DKG75_18660 [Zavarzinia compransoris]TDP48992.1 hypothetical protein DES42_101353 [Zavarzinia compransoris]
MERTYARALLLAGPTMVGAGFLAYALFAGLAGLAGPVLAAAVTGLVFLAPALIVGLSRKKPVPTVTGTVSTTAAAANAQLRTIAEAVHDNPLGAAASTALQGVAGLLDPDRRRK